LTLIERYQEANLSPTDNPNSDTSEKNGIAKESRVEAFEALTPTMEDTSSQIIANGAQIAADSEEGGDGPLLLTLLLTNQNNNKVSTISIDTLHS
jgi:hypothetical protein